MGIADGIMDTLGISGSGVGDTVYAVQTGAFRNPRYAQELLDELLELDYPAFISEGNGYFRVQVGNFGTLQEATEMERRLRRDGYQTVIVTD